MAADFGSNPTAASCKLPPSRLVGVQVEALKGQGEIARKPAYEPRSCLLIIVFEQPAELLKHTSP